MSPASSVCVQNWIATVILQKVSHTHKRQPSHPTHISSDCAKKTKTSREKLQKEPERNRTEKQTKWMSQRYWLVGSIKFAKSLFIPISLSGARIMLDKQSSVSNELSRGRTAE